MLNLDISTIGTRVAERLAGFPAFLRANGFTVGADAVPTLRTAQLSSVLRADLLRWSLQALLCGRADEWRRFDDLFDAWFLPANRWQQPVVRDAPHTTRGLQVGAASGDASSDSAPDDVVRPPHAASHEQALGSADFRTLTAREHIVDIESLMRRFARRIRQMQLRRTRRADRGRRLDLPATIRRSVASGGTPIDLAWRLRRRVQPRLVLLIDVSRSMSITSFFYLRLARALAAERSDVHSFIFHTHTTAVSRALHDPDPWRAQQQLHFIAQGFGGGTRIGDSLAQFNREHAPRLLHSRSAVLIFSDGYDTGEPQRLSEALAELKRRARCVVWIHPLLDDPAFAPVSIGMQAARPHIHLLASGGSLRALGDALPRIIDAIR
jgi:uncharacterized protein with von Willebrand factor type A (vWA) domain